MMVSGISRIRCHLLPSGLWLALPGRNSPGRAFPCLLILFSPRFPIYGRPRPAAACLGPGTEQGPLAMAMWGTRGDAMVGLAGDYKFQGASGLRTRVGDPVFGAPHNRDLF